MKVQRLEGKGKRACELANAKLNIFEGSVRSGKTIVSLLRWLQFVRTGPAGNLLMVGKTERTLKRNVIDPLVEMLGPARCRFVSGSGELWLLGRRVYIAGANDERSLDKIRGLTLVGAYVDEASTCPESFWSMLLTRLSVEGASLFATTNPDSPNHWLKRDYIDRAALWLKHDGTIEEHDEPDRLDLAVFSFRLADNPTLPPSYVDEMNRTFVGLWRLRFIEGLWVLAEGAIYPMLGPTHTRQTIPDVLRWWVGVDYGTANPFVAVLVGETVDGRLCVVSEYRHDGRRSRRQLTDSQYSEAMAEWLHGEAEKWTRDGRIELERVFVDPSAASFITQLWSDGWDRVSPADNAVSDGLRDVASLLGAGLLEFYGPGDGGGMAEMQGYVWDPKAQEKGEDAPLKVDDHFPDALRYLVRGTRLVWRHWLGRAFDQAA